MSTARKIVDALLEGEEDLSAFSDAAIGATLSAWTESADGEDHYWSCPTTIGRKAASYNLIMQLYSIESVPGREAISILPQLWSKVGDIGDNAHWFGFTFASPEAESYVISSIYRATLEMAPRLKKPVKWSASSGKALPTAELHHMKATIMSHVMTPEAKALGVTTFTGIPKFE